MTRVSYLLTITVPDEIDPDTAAEILEHAELHDTTEEARIGRWLGGQLDRLEGDLDLWLPESWHVSIIQLAGKL